MRLPFPEQKEEPDTILPLINVVFLLLIFFIMTGALHAVDYFNVNPPSSSSEIQGSLDDTIILVGSDGRIAIGNKEMDGADMQLAILDRLAANSSAVVRIKADGRVDAARVVEIMELIEAVGVGRVLLLTLEPGG